ncbi:CPBP family intramembrane glutamic endopeptidase [Sphingobacterium rhinopitheci]|uniref:CPBP family intramembrane glutamic endopeptidase n=1 Tax=Sphingobacterium rhinopitheci TaxID=2781960 RepID=UPI001F526A3B|nr:CPBP family intramembrane glutamic endopeptidase [Sphingobacterium rhinopitheci]MCI0921574.1 CPBP family intramembrane metalloprotease [Sphingobacterium rhinopitheci]
MNKYGIKTNPTWISLTILLGLTLACAVGAQLLVVFIEVLLNGGFSTMLDDSMGIDFKNNPIFSYALIISGSLGTFLLPALLLKRIEPYNDYFPMQTKGLPIFLSLAALLLIAFMPMMQWIGEVNMNMSFPPDLKGLESWMRMKEDDMAALTKDIVMVDSWTLLFVNLFAIAVVPAIAEEYYFRGSLMNIVARVVKNKHITIWITAIIFSAIHVQFFGFVPRMILGAFFGYMLLWSQNIWVPIMGHFINNGAAVVLSFYYARQGKTYEELQASEGYSIIVYLGSFILTGIIGWYFYTTAKKINNSDGKGLD